MKVLVYFHFPHGKLLFSLSITAPACNSQLTSRLEVLIAYYKQRLLLIYSLIKLFGSEAKYLWGDVLYCTTIYILETLTKLLRSVVAYFQNHFWRIRSYLLLFFRVYQAFS